MRHEGIAFRIATIGSGNAPRFDVFFCTRAFAFGELRELYNSEGNRGKEWVVTKQKLRCCRIRFTFFLVDHTEIGCRVNRPLACVGTTSM